MKFHIDINTRRFVRSAAAAIPLETLFFKRRDTFEVEVVFVDRSGIVPTPAGTTFLAGIKSSFGGDFLALTNSAGVLDLHTTGVEALFAAEPEKVSAYFEIKSTTIGEETRTHTLQIDLQNAVILGDEGVPADSPSLKASQADAQAGISNDKWMTPLRTAEAIAALATGGGGGGVAVTWSTLTGKPSTFTPSAHTHAFSDITGKPATFAPSAHSHDYSEITGKPSTFPPSAHTHSIADTTGLAEALAAKQPLGNYAATSHTHSAADLTSGTIDPARLPVLPSSIQVVSSSTIPNLTQAEQDQIVAGAVVTTSDGGRYIYRAGAKTNLDSYVKLADLTPDWSVITNKPTTFTPATHQHTISETTGLQAALDGKQPTGSYATAAQGALADSASQPGHTHSTSQITGLDTSLASKISGTGVTSLEVVQSLPATLVPTTFYILIPSGATAATSVQLGSIPLFTGSGGGQDIVTSGLMLHLDAGNTSSYSGSGTIWSDISPNGYTATLVNGAGFNSTQGGSITFDGVNDYVSTDFSPYLTDFTYMLWIRPASTGGSAWAGAIDQGGKRIFAREQLAPNWFALPSGNNPNLLKLSNVPLDAWSCIIISRQSEMWSMSINGPTNKTSYQYGSAAVTGQLILGVYQNAFFSGRMGILKIYNRALSDAEIQQNYDARKSRFGI
jgi:hypothetical protein